MGFSRSGAEQVKTSTQNHLSQFPFTLTNLKFLSNFSIPNHFFKTPPTSIPQKLSKIPLPISISLFLNPPIFIPSQLQSPNLNFNPTPNLSPTPTSNFPIFITPLNHSPHINLHFHFSSTNKPHTSWAVVRDSEINRCVCVEKKSKSWVRATSLYLGLQ